MLEQLCDRLLVARRSLLEGGRADEADPRGHVDADEVASQLQSVHAREGFDERSRVGCRQFERQTEEVQPRLARAFSDPDDGLAELCGPAFGPRHPGLVVRLGR